MRCGFNQLNYLLGTTVIFILFCEIYIEREKEVKKSGFEMVGLTWSGKTRAYPAGATRNI
jgi:hypothetical protein